MFSTAQQCDTHTCPSSPPQAVPTALVLLTNCKRKFLSTDLKAFILPNKDFLGRGDDARKESNCVPGSRGRRGCGETGPVPGSAAFSSGTGLPDGNGAKSKVRELLMHRRRRFIIALETATQTVPGGLTSESSPSLILFTQYPVFANCM